MHALIKSIAVIEFGKLLRGRVDSFALGAASRFVHLLGPRCVLTLCLFLQNSWLSPLD